MKDTRPVWARNLGALVRVGNFGEATHDTPVLVPADVAAELSGSDAVILVDPMRGAVPPAAQASSEPARASAYHALGGKVYHADPGCSVGNNIEPASRQPGEGGLKPCRECARG